MISLLFFTRSSLAEQDLSGRAGRNLAVPGESRGHQWAGKWPPMGRLPWPPSAMAGARPVRTAPGGRHRGNDTDSCPADGAPVQVPQSWLSDGDVRRTDTGADHRSLPKLLARVAEVLAGRAGARPARRMAIAGGQGTLLRLLRAPDLEDPVRYASWEGTSSPCSRLSGAARRASFMLNQGAVELGGCVVVVIYESSPPRRHPRRMTIANTRIPTRP